MLELYVLTLANIVFAWMKQMVFTLCSLFVQVFLLVYVRYISDNADISKLGHAEIWNIYIVLILSMVQDWL